jgi:chemotaxis protein methyltransferase CheR
VRILATDINVGVLEKAREGIYAEEKLKNMPKILRTRYFNKFKKGQELQYQVRDNLKELIVYRQFNLLAEKYPLKGGIDVIFLRNVMIYFDNDTRQTIVRKMHGLLKRKGIFIVGNAESLAGRAASFESVKPAVYLKK